MAILGSIRNQTEVESLKPQNAVQPVTNEKNPPQNPIKIVGPSTKNLPTPVSEAEYYGITKKTILPKSKKKGFFKSFIQGVDREAGEQSTGAGTAGDVIGSIVRVPTQKIVEAAVEATPTRRAQRAEINKIRMTDPETAKMIEDNSIGKDRTTTQNVVQAAAGLGELALTLIPVGLLGKAGRVAMSTAEIAGLNRLGRVGRYAASGIKAGSSIGAKTAFGSATGGAYGSLYGFLSGLEDGGDLGKAFKNSATYGIAGILFGATIPLAMKTTGSFFGGARKGAKATADIVSKGIPTSFRPSTYISKLPKSLQEAILPEGYFFKKNFGDVGEETVKKLRAAYTETNLPYGEFQSEAIKLGLIKEPVVARGAYGDLNQARELVGGREFKFDMADLLQQKNKFSDPAVRTEFMAKNPEVKKVFDFFDKNRKELGLRSQAEGVTDKLLDINKYFPLNTPQIPLSGSARKLLESATDDIEREVIYRNNSPVVDDMIEYGFRNGQYKTKADGYKSYYDAMDSALNLGKVKDIDNTYFKWLQENGHAKSIDDAKKMYLEALNAPQRPFTPRASSLDYNRKLPMPWTDPDPMRVFDYYVRSANKRLAFAKQFGPNDEIVEDLRKGVIALNGGDKNLAAFDKAFRRMTGQFDRAPLEEKWSAFATSLQTLKMAFSQIVNLSTLLNYPIMSDFKHLGVGLKKAFEVEGMRDSVERGIFATDAIGQTTPFANWGDKFRDKILKNSGFTYTEMMNRLVGVGVSESWAKTNLNKLLESKGIKLLPEESENITKMLVDKKKGNIMKLERGYENTGKLAKEFSEKFPYENFSPAAGNIELAQKKLATLETNIQTKVEKLQKARQYYEERMMQQGRKLTDQDVVDLRDAITVLEDSIEIYKGKGQLVSSPTKQYTDEEVKSAVDGVVKLRRNQMQKMIDDLENEFDEARALGISEPTMQVDKPVLSQEQKVAATNAKIKSIDDAILSLQNELTDKERLLNGIIDAYKISGEQIAKEFPEGSAYDKFIGEKKASLGGLENSPEIHNLKELGIDPEEAVARGFFTKEELTKAAQMMVEYTQGGHDPLNLPGFFRSPYGKVFGQFKSFAYMQANFLGKEAVKNLASKDTASVYKGLKFLTTAGALYPMTYGVLKDIRDIVTLKKSPEDAFELSEYWDGLSKFAAMGIYVDFIRSASQGRTYEFLAGPTISDAVKYWENVVGPAGKFLSGEKASLKPLRKQLLNQTGVGRVLNNVIDN